MDHSPRKIAQHVIARCGGFKAAAQLGGVSVNAVYQWVRRNGIPADRQRVLVENARARGLVLRPDDFFAPTGDNIPDSLQGVNSSVNPSAVLPLS